MAGWATRTRPSSSACTATRNPETCSTLQVQQRYTVDDSTSAGAGSTFVETVEVSGTYAGNTVVVSNEGTTYVIVSLESGGAGSTSST